MYPQNAFKLGSFVQLVPNVSSSKITPYGLATMHTLNVILLFSPIPQSTNLLKHIQYFVKHNVRYLMSPSSPLWAINSKAP